MNKLLENLDLVFRVLLCLPMIALMVTVVPLMIYLEARQWTRKPASSLSNF
jgi:hypothetical protein